MQTYIELLGIKWYVICNFFIIILKYKIMKKIKIVKTKFTILEIFEIEW